MNLATLTLNTRRRNFRRLEALVNMPALRYGMFPWGETSTRKAPWAMYATTIRLDLIDDSAAGEVTVALRRELVGYKPHPEQIGVTTPATTTFVVDFTRREIRAVSHQCPTAEFCFGADYEGECVVAGKLRSCRRDGHFLGTVAHLLKEAA